jgi:hypothetical protein
MKAARSVKRSSSRCVMCKDLDARGDRHQREPRCSTTHIESPEFIVKKISASISSRGAEIPRRIAKKERKKAVAQEDTKHHSFGASSAASANKTQAVTQTRKSGRSLAVTRCATWTRWYVDYNSERKPIWAGLASAPRGRTNGARARSSAQQGVSAAIGACV